LFPVDFVIVDMDEDRDVPIILGRPFMKTARMMIDIDDGLMKVRVQDEEVAFNLFEAKKHFNVKHDSFRIDATKEGLVEIADQVHVSNPSEKSLIGVYKVLTKNEGLDMTKEVEEPKLEPNLKYLFLGDDCTKPVVVSNTLSTKEEDKLIQVLKKKGVVKLLEAGMICSISDGEWVSVVQVVPKTGGIRFYRRFIKNLLKTTKPLRKLLNKAGS